MFYKVGYSRIVAEPSSEQIPNSGCNRTRVEKWTQSLACIVKMIIHLKIIC